LLEQASTDFMTIDQIKGSALLELSEAPIASIRQGLSVSAFDRLRGVLGCSAAELASALGMATRTLARRRTAGRLTHEESDRLLRTARLVEVAIYVFESEGAAAEWMNSPKRLLGGETPLRHADTVLGAREVEDMLFAIEFSAAA
jgi:putative toxin-antitoxin system antitoxin component (TIGR02293 family)